MHARQATSQVASNSFSRRRPFGAPTTYAASSLMVKTSTRSGIMRTCPNACPAAKDGITGTRSPEPARRVDLAISMQAHSVAFSNGRKGLAPSHEVVATFVAQADVYGRCFVREIGRITGRARSTVSNRLGRVRVASCVEVGTANIGLAIT